MWLFFPFDVVDYIHFLSDRVSYEAKEMDPQLSVASEDYSSFPTCEPLIFLGGWAMTGLDRVIPRFHPASGYGYFVSRPLPPCDHLTEWVETKGENMSDFRDKGTPVPEFQSGCCTSLKDDIDEGHESIIGESLIATLFHDIVGNDPV